MVDFVTFGNFAGKAIAGEERERPTGKAIEVPEIVKACLETLRRIGPQASSGTARYRYDSCLKAVRDFEASIGRQIYWEPIVPPPPPPKRPMSLLTLFQRVKPPETVEKPLTRERCLSTAKRPDPTVFAWSLRGKTRDQILSIMVDVLKEDIGCPALASEYTPSPGFYWKMASEALGEEINPEKLAQMFPEMFPSLRRADAKGRTHSLFFPGEELPPEPPPPEPPPPEPPPPEPVSILDKIKAALPSWWPYGLGAVILLGGGYYLIAGKKEVK